MTKIKVSKLKTQNVTDSELQNDQSNPVIDTTESAPTSTVPIRIAQATKLELERLISLIERDGGQRRVKPDLIIRHALAKLKEQDLEEIRSKTVSYSELFDRELRAYRSSQGEITRDEFLGLVLLGKVKIRNLVSVSRGS